MTQQKKQQLIEGFAWLFRSIAIALLMMILKNQVAMYNAYIVQDEINKQQKALNERFDKLITTLQQDKVDKSEFYPLYNYYNRIFNTNPK